MLSFFELYNKLTEGTLGDLLKQAGIGVKDDPTATPDKPISAGKSPLPVAPRISNKPRIDPTEPAPEAPEAPPRSSSNYRGEFVNKPASYNQGPVIHQDNPAIGLSMTKQVVDPGAHLDRPDETPALHIEPAILSYRKQYPDLADAFMALNRPYSRKEPFNMKQIDQSAGLDKIMAALQVLKDDKRIDFTDTRGNPMKLSRADLGEIQFVPSDSLFRGSRTGLRTATPEEQEEADREAIISPPIAKRGTSATTPKPGIGPQKSAESRPEMSAVERIAGGLNTLFAQLAAADQKGEDLEKFQTSVDKLWMRLDDLEQTGGPREKAAAHAWKAELDNKATKFGLRSSNEAVDWYNYFNLMESYHPSIMK